MKSVLRRKFVILGTYQPDSVFTWACEDRWLFFEAKRDAQAQKSRTYCATPRVGTSVTTFYVDIFLVLNGLDCHAARNIQLTILIVITPLQEIQAFWTLVLN